MLLTFQPSSKHMAVDFQVKTKNVSKSLSKLGSSAV